MADQPYLQSQLQQLEAEYRDGEITQKGYEKRRTLLLEQFKQYQQPHNRHNPHNPNNTHSPYGSSQSAPSQHLLSPQQNPESLDRTSTMMSGDFRFNPQQQYQQQNNNGFADDTSRLNTLDSSQGYFSDFAGQQKGISRDSYGGPQRYSTAEGFSPSAGIPPPMLTAQDLPPPGSIQYQMPLEPRDIPFDSLDPLNSSISMSKFDNIGAVLKHRGRTNPRTTAFWVLDNKGKEIASITFEKLSARAEKLAQVIRDKSRLIRGHRVALVYRDYEVVDFAVALFGCFLAGVVAVPMNGVEGDFAKLQLLLNTTQAHLALTTEENLKKFQRDVEAKKRHWPTGVEWWKTNEFGSNPSKKREIETLPAPDLAYIEFSRAPTGDLRGVVLSHRTIMHQMTCLQAIMSTIPVDGIDKTTAIRTSVGGTTTASVPAPKSGPETITSYLDPREGIGMIIGILFCVYGGHTSIYVPPSSVETPGLYAYLVTKYRTTTMLADYPGLMRAVYNYQADPMATRSFKNKEPNFSSVRICLIDTLTIDPEFHDLLADRWLKPLRNTRARELVAPILCLPEHGGMIIATRDWLGGEEQMGCPLSTPTETNEEEETDQELDNSQGGFTSLLGQKTKVIKSSKPKSRTDLSEVLLDKEALVRNEVKVLAVGSESARRANEPGTLRVGAFGYPIADATLAVVDPESTLLCAPYSIGEIWVDSPSLSGGFWALPKHTETIFHARPYRFVAGNPNPIIVEPEFLRSGLLGFVFEGKVFVLGLYEDRIRQKIEDTIMPDLDHRYFFVQHLVISIMKRVLKIYDCSAFDTPVNNEYLPIVVLETQAASTAPTTTGGPPRQLDIPFLDSLSEKVMDTLFNEHNLRVYCVLITAPNSLPRIIRNGRREIGNMLCRKEFDHGTLASVHVKFGVDRAVINLPYGDDPLGGIWSSLATQVRQQMLMTVDKQYSGMDYREVVIDDRTSAPLNQFSNIHDLLQYRVTRHPEELSFCTIDSRVKEGKGVNWKKLDQKIAAVAMYLKNKVKIQPGDHVLLMYTHSEEFIYATHAAMCLGAVAIPMAPIDPDRLNEDAPALLHIISDFRIKAILVNNDVENIIKQKQCSQHLKQSATVLRVNLPHTYNTTKPPKQSHGCRELSLNIKPAWVQPGYPVIIWIYWTPDQRRIAVQLGHNTLMALCKVQKETCQMTALRPILGCVRSTVGLGFVHTCLMGIYLASPTYLVSPVDFAHNPNVLFHTLSRYKVKDTYATSNMLDHAMAYGAGRGHNLQEVKNLMITVESRPKVDTYQKIRTHFAQAGLDRTAVNTIYSHVLNPMITSRSYMCIEPIELWLDRDSLRRGIIAPVHPDQDPTALLVQDSGMVPVSTQVCVVNPETNYLCHVGELGEIWVQSEANVFGFYGSKDILDSERFNGRVIDGDRSVQYVRTGDLGFLHSVARPIGPNGGLVDMQVLFVLGNIGETFEVNGLIHFPTDIEMSVETCHRNIVNGGCAVFQAGGLVVLLAEVDRKNFLASIVPVIVNSVLNNHHFVVDIVAFVSKGDFPRSRLNEKQRGKILASWVTRKMRTIAQFAIRDPSEDDDGTSTRRRSSMGPRASMGSGIILPPVSGGSVRNPSISTTSYDNIPTELQGMTIHENMNTGPVILPNNEFHLELPTTYPQNQMIPEMSSEHMIQELPANEMVENQTTPTASRPTSQTVHPTNHAKIDRFNHNPETEKDDDDSSYSPVEISGPFTAGQYEGYDGYSGGNAPLTVVNQTSLSHMPSSSSTYSPVDVKRHMSQTSKNLASTAQNLPGSFLPPTALSDFDFQIRDGQGEDDASQFHKNHQTRYSGQTTAYNATNPVISTGPVLPSYAHKPYLSMLTEETGREGYIPSSSTYDTNSQPNSRPSSRPSSRTSSRTGSSYPPPGSGQAQQFTAFRQGPIVYPPLPSIPSPGATTPTADEDNRQLHSSLHQQLQPQPQSQFKIHRRQVSKLPEGGEKSSK